MPPTPTTDRTNQNRHESRKRSRGVPFATLCRVAITPQKQSKRSLPNGRHVTAALLVGVTLVGLAYVLFGIGLGAALIRQLVK